MESNLRKGFELLGSQQGRRTTFTMETREEQKPDPKIKYAKYTTMLQCLECGKKWPENTKDLQAGITECPECGSTDVDIA